ncbi:1-phosphatidylinositol 4,5-bisphosphate phosphodiesterase eta-1 isoform X1 [Petromyzon marinus]|uniref:1-phosphatidylinositol 4,5-bisphosphate phosphodiesterase eta-1 isoform X1 n=1 Tax=Petromyzon marinus TaxID=7757 RepID=UPI003F6E6B30
MALKSEDAGTNRAKMVSDENLFTAFLEEARAPKRPSARRRATMPSGRLTSPTDAEDEDPGREAASDSGFDTRASGKTPGALSPPRYSRHFLSDNSIFHVEKSLTAMQSGTQMIKLKGGPKGLPRLYYLDEQRSCIRWRPSRKQEKAKIAIDSVREVCEGRHSEIFQRYPEGSFDPACCLCIYHGSHTEWLAVVTGSADEARSWLTGLRYLMAGINDEDCLAKRQRTRDQWLKQTFMEADKNGDGSLSIDEVLLLMHKLNVNLPRRKVKQMFQEADTDTDKGTLTFEEFCALYQKMSTRRDLYLILLRYSNRKDHLTVDELQRFLQIEQQMTDVSREHCVDVVNMFEPCEENKQQGILGIDGFTNYMRSPEGDIFNMEHYKVNQDMMQPLSHYFIASSHNTYLTGDQLMSHSRADMYAWVLQAGCRCVEVDCWDGPDGEPIVYHGHTLTSKILFRDVIEIINKYAFVKSQFPVILSIENHCSVPQQKKMAECMREILADKLDLSRVADGDPSRLPSPQSLVGKILVKGKKLPANISDDAEEGDVSDEDSADEIEEACKLINGDNSSPHRKLVESFAKRRLEFMKKESKLRSHEEEVEEFTIGALPRATKPAICLQQEQLPKSEGTEVTEEFAVRKRRSIIRAFQKEKKRNVKPKVAADEAEQENGTQSDCARLNGQESRGSGSHRASPRRGPGKTMKLSRALSDLVQYTRSVAVNDVDHDAVASSWQVSSFSENKASQMLQQKSQAFLAFNQRQLSRIYPSSYRVDSSNFNPQPYWNVGCQMVALNYQTSGRVMEMNRARFMDNGNCGYVLKPDCIFDGTFRPFSEDPLPGYPKTQLIVKVISGQQLPKPPDSMLGDRGEIIDPFVEVEIIGLPVDCCKEQTRVIDDNGFNPVWDETLVFTLHMPEMALIRFLVWDHDPIGRDFIGQRTISFNGMMPGYRHVYLEGVAEASVFVHVVIKEFSGKIKQVGGLKSLFSRSVKHGSLDSRTSYFSRRRSLGKDFLRRTSSVPAKGRRKNKSMSLLVTSEKEGEDAERPACGSAAAGAVGNPGEAPAADGTTATAAPVTSAPSARGPSRRDGAAEEEEEVDGGERDASSRGAQADSEGCREGAGGIGSACPNSAPDNRAHSNDLRSSTPPRPLLLHMINRASLKRASSQKSQSSDPPSPTCGANPDASLAAGGPTSRPDARHYASHPLLSQHASLESQDRDLSAASDSADSVNGFDGDISTSSESSSDETLAKRAERVPGSQDHGLVTEEVTRRAGHCQDPLDKSMKRSSIEPSPMFSVNVTANDKLWRPLDGKSVRDSVASASSVSSADTVIDAFSYEGRSSIAMLKKKHLENVFLRGDTVGPDARCVPSGFPGANESVSPPASSRLNEQMAVDSRVGEGVKNDVDIGNQTKLEAARSDFTAKLNPDANGMSNNQNNNHINVGNEDNSSSALGSNEGKVPFGVVQLRQKKSTMPDSQGQIEGNVPHFRFPSEKPKNDLERPCDNRQSLSSFERVAMLKREFMGILGHQWNDEVDSGNRPNDQYTQVTPAMETSSALPNGNEPFKRSMSYDVAYFSPDSAAVMRKDKLNGPPVSATTVFTGHPAVFGGAEEIPPSTNGETSGPDPCGGTRVREMSADGDAIGGDQEPSPDSGVLLRTLSLDPATSMSAGKRAAAGAHGRRPRCDTATAARPSWNRLCMQTLVQSSKAAAEVNAPPGDSVAAKSKSLGDLTSDDIVSNFQSKYKSICRSFITKSMRDQRRMVALGRLPSQPQNPLTEQIIQLATLTQDEVPEYTSSPPHRASEGSTSPRLRSPGTRNLGPTAMRERSFSYGPAFSGSRSRSISDGSSLHRRTTMPVNLLRSVSTEQQGASGPQRRLLSGQPPSGGLKRSQFAQRYPASSYGLFRHSVGSLDGINVNPLLTERREAPDGACSTLTKTRFMEEPSVVGKAPSYSEPNLSEEPEVFFMLNL